MTAPTIGRVAALARRLPARARAAAARLPGALAPPIEPGTSTPRIAIVGSGFGGIGLGCRLRQAGISTFTIYEKADEVGGTWRDNSYPGAACDVPSHLYSFSFAPNPSWSKRFPQQPEILAYLNEVTDRFGLRPHLRFGTELCEATWDDDAQCWHLSFGDGSTADAEVLVAATGQLNRPQLPDIDGIDDFAGTSFHSARWDHHHDLTDRDVAVIGVGASAIQFVPEVAKVARSVTVFQRSANYVGPKGPDAVRPKAQWVLDHVPGGDRLYRFSLWARFEGRIVWFHQGSRTGRLIQRKFNTELSKLVSDELSAEALIPDYEFGCKRVLISNDWYPTLLRPNVQVVTDPVERITAADVVAGGTERPVDTIVYGTGFASTGFLVPMRITGRDGADLHERWAGGAEAHLGITVAGFPNLFILYGPNTNLGHNSIVFMLERQIAYVLTLVRRMIDGAGAAVEVRPQVQAASNARLERELDDLVWSGSCHSWYKTDTGKITNNWSGSTITYWARTAWPKAGDFEHRAARVDAHSGPGGSPE